MKMEESTLSLFVFFLVFWAWLRPDDAGKWAGALVKATQAAMQ